MEMHDEVMVRSYRKVNMCADALAKAGANTGEDLVLKDISCFIRHLMDIHRSKDPTSHGDV